MTKKLGKIGFVDHGQWSASTVYAKLDLVTVPDAGSFRSRTDNNVGHNPLTDTANWAPVSTGAYAKQQGDYAKQQGDYAAGFNQKVQRINLTLGPYVDRAPLNLQAVEQNVAINRAGVKVAKQGWGIATFVAEKGNEYLFNPGIMDGDVCIFAEHIVKQETRSINYTYTYDADGYPTKATATYNGVIHTYTFTYEKDEEGHVTSETIKDDQTGETLAALPYQYRATVGTYSPLTILNASAELPSDGYCRFISHFQGNGTIEVVVSFNLATADKTMLLLRDGFTANLATQLGNLSQKIDESNRALSVVEDVTASANAGIDGILADGADDASLPTLCGQPQILFGAGTPAEALVPDNWKQFDPETGEGYQWNGQPSAIGQQYIDTVTPCRYIAIRTANYGLQWLKV